MKPLTMWLSQSGKAAEALAHKEGIKLCPSGVAVANLLGLSEQVPGMIL